MKLRFRGTLLLVCLAVALTTSAVLTQRAVAKERDSEHITFAEPIMVGGTLLKSDTYKLVWDGSGPQVQVSFLRGSKTVVTASATLMLERNANDGAVEVKTMDDNSKVLERITWKKKSLVFSPSS
jgi:hypothetical protein